MCGRFVLVQVGHIGVRFSAIVRYPSEYRPDLRKLPDYVDAPRYNIAPTQQLLTVTNEDGERVIEPMRWGLIPSWAKDGQKLPLNINARDDRMATGGFWRRPLRRQRCLIPADGYYEWTGPKKNRTPVYIRRKDEGLIAFAGLFDVWRHPNTGEVTRSCAIVTTSPSPSLEPIHNRMPAILSNEAEALWLDPLTQDPGPLRALVQPYPDEALEHYPVEKTVNTARAQGPELINRAPTQPGMVGLTPETS